jgi:1,4-alpha-glucan branching enzyme
MASAGELAIVLHSHMPYVEGFGTWPFGEEWLWEAIATSYLPVLELLDAGAALTLSMTPVLCDQLEAPGALDRCREFLATVRVESHRRDIASAAGTAEVAALEHSAAQYERARERLEGLDLLAALGRHVAWTSSATHAILPLLATDAGVRLQLRAGIDAHRRRFGERWRGGLWLPECAYAPWLDALLHEAGVRAVCVDVTDVLDDHLRPLRTAAGPLLVPIDRATIELVWSRGGYPSGAAYRDYYDFTPHRHRARAVDGSPYDPARATAAARRDGADFVARTRARVAGGGLAVCALDTELIGDWWHEGPLWLAAVVDEAARQGLALTRLDDALERRAPAAAAPDLPVTSWGTPRDLSTWSAPPVGDMAWSARDAELRTIAAGARADLRAVRELLALQSSDWAFLVARDLAEPYGRERAAGHRANLDAALAAPGTLGPRLHDLAPDATTAVLLEP